MVRTVARSNSGEIEPEVDRQRNRFSGLEARIQERDKWWETVLEMSTQIEPLALRREFVGLVNSSHEAKRQYTDLLDEKKECEDDAAREQQALRQEIKKIKEDFDAVKRRNVNLQQRNANLQQQNASLQQQIREHGVVCCRDEAPARTARKRQRAQSSDSEYEDSDDHPRERVRVSSDGFSREQIRAVLGGSDRGWGSMQSCPGIYTYHTLLDAGAHLFGQTPSRRQNVAEAVFGFGPDDDVISGAIVFPLFVRNQSGPRSRFTYLGNYVAIRLDPAAWERLSEEGKNYAVQTVRSKGMSTDSSLHKMEKAMEHGAIYHQFHHGIFKAPCSRLEFRSFDEELNTGIQNALGRKARLRRLFELES